MTIKLCKTILIEHRLTHKAIYGLNLTLYLGAQVFCVTTIKEAIDLAVKEEIDFIFIDNGAYTQDMAKKCYFALDTANTKVQMFIVGKTSLNEGDFHIFDRNTSIRAILQSLAKYLNISAKLMSELEFDEHYAIPLELVVPGWICPRSIYKRTDNRFEEVLIPNSVVTENFIDSLIKLDIESLYVRSTDRLQFVNSLTLQISTMLNDMSISKDDRIELTAKAHQIVMEQARQMGISESTMDLAHDCLSSMNTLIKEIKDLDSLFSELLKNNQTYMYKHCFLAIYIGTHLIKKMTWSSKDQQEKFSFICFFHDISLKKDEYAHLHSDEEVNQLDVPEAEKRIILSHALDSAKIISTYPRIPFGVDTIIKQHHGSKTGIGYEKSYKDLSPLACIFILSEEWAKMSIRSWESEQIIDKDKIIETLYQKHNNQAFQKIIPYLKILDI